MRKKRKIQRMFVIVLAFAMILTSIVWPDATNKVKATALAINDDEYDIISVLSAKGDVLTSTQTDTVHVKDGAYDGGIEVINIIGNGAGNSKALTAKYLKITYQIPDISSITPETELFTFQPYTSSWGGWQQNIIKFKDAIKNQDSSYTSYIAVRTIKASMGEEEECSGINLGFCQSEPTITLTGYYAMSVKASKGEAELYESNKDANLTSPQVTVITGQQMAEKGISVSNLIKSKTSITPYIKFTKAHTHSWIKFTCQGNGSSNKALVGTQFDGGKSGSENTDNGASTTNFVIHCGYGTTQGPKSGVGAAGTGIYNKIPSLDTGKWSGQSESNVSLKLQIMTKDTECKVLGVVFGDKQAFTVNDDGTITKGFNTSGIKTESQTPDATDVKPKSEAELKSETEDDLWLQLRRAKNIKREDCLTSELYQALQEEITKGQAALDDNAATSASLIAALNNLKSAVLNATNEAPMGLKKAIDYCKSLKETDYSSESFAKLAPAIATAEKAYADTSKKDSELKAARDALEAVRVALVPKVSTAASNPKDFRILSKKDIIKEMGAGINLGNTMDGGLYNVSETSWQAYKTTKAYIKALHDAGYNTVRIPVTWGEHINDDYTIKEAWINRVQEIVDYCIDQDMYAIVNIHHDGAANHDDRGNNTPACWLDTYQWDIEKVYQKYQGVWKTIASRFKDYDEHLILESMNEVTDAHKLASGQKNEDDQVLNALNQLFINTVRSTGSNNTKRWLGITGRFATTNAITKMPEDILADKGEVGTTRLMFAVHIYKGNSNVRWEYADKKGGLQSWWESLSSSIKNVEKLDKNMPLYVGEYGVRTKKQSGSATGYNNAERALNYETCAAASDFYGAVPIVWDQGTGNYLGVAQEEGLFTDWDRPNLRPVYDDVVHGTIRGTYEAREGNLGDRMSAIYKSYGHASTSDNSVSTDPVITPATDISLSDDSLLLKAGERKTVTGTSDSPRDVILWSTEDDSVATVSRGLIHAKGIGITTIHAKSQSGSVTKDIKVVVAPTGNETATAVKTEKPYYQITEGDTLQIKASLTPEDSKDAITYTSSNTEIATVSSRGKVTAENPGTTYIIVSAASGVNNIVAIRVKKKGEYNQVSATLNLLFQSGLTEKSAPINMTGDGQYTLTYDLSKDLSADGKAAGINKLEKLTSIYIRDTNTLKPVVSQAKIRYDKITVNDKELTLKKTKDMDEDGFKNLLKESGQLDSNDPINAWDGSAVEEVSVDTKDHVASFTGIDNPTKISVTFTIRGMKFFPVSEKSNEATKLESVTEKKFVIATVGETKDIELDISPEDTDSEVTFFSTNSAVALVNNSNVTVDTAQPKGRKGISIINNRVARKGGNGKIRTSITALGEGVATLVGITENGLKVLYTVGVGEKLQAENLPEPVDPTPEGLDGSLWEEPGASTEPENSSKPDTSSKPNTSSEPGSSTTPNTSAEPGSSSEPNTSSKPTEPNTSSEPGNQNTPTPTPPRINLDKDNITQKNPEDDIKDSTQQAIRLSAAKSTKRSITLRWKKIKGADGYIIYTNKCGLKNKYKKYKTLSKNVTKFVQKKLKPKTYYKYFVVAYKKVNGKKKAIVVSRTIHITTKGGKYGNATGVKVNKSKVGLKVGKKFTIKAKEYNNKKMPIKIHRKIKFESSNNSIAKVSSKGKITGVSKGNCIIYAYAQNLKCKKIHITVK